MKITLSFDAADPSEIEEANRIVAALKGATAAPGVDSAILVPVGASYAGHSYNALSRARRAGTLEAAMTTAGLRFTREAFDAWETLRANGIARRGPRKAKAASTKVVDLTATRIKVLERAGLRSKA